MNCLDNSHDSPRPRVHHVTTRTQTARPSPKSRETHRWRGFPSTLPFAIATGVPGTSQGHTPTSYTLNCDEPAKAKNDACDAVVSIRCREGRTAEQPHGLPAQVRRFYSLSRRAYSGTRAFQREKQLVVDVSIRRREGRTAELYWRPARRAVRQALRLLFAVAKGVQRNEAARLVVPDGSMFLFAVAKGVQRNSAALQADRASHRVSIRCRERRTAEPPLSGGRTAYPPRRVSIRCREGRTAERGQNGCIVSWRVTGFLFAVAKGVQRNTNSHEGWSFLWRFLFAVAKGVQRNSIAHITSVALIGGFYSLSRRAYSGTVKSCPPTLVS